MIRLLSPFLVLLALLASGARASASATTVTTNEVIPIDFVFEGCEEPIQLTGRLHLVHHVTLDPNGGYTLMWHSQPQGVVGTGLNTGVRYQGTGVGQEVVTGRLGETISLAGSFKIIGRGRTSNFLWQGVLHLTVAPDGSVRSFVDRINETCR